MTVSGYQEENKIVSISSGSSQATVTQTSGSFTGSITPGGNSVTLYIEPNSNVFNLNQAENFYFIITQNVSGGEYIVTG